MSDKKPQRLLGSRAYQKAMALVSGVIASPERLSTLVANAQEKFARQDGGRFSEIVGKVRASFRLLKSYASGKYRDISFESLALIVGSIIYFVMPFDALPDFILALGFTDDAALLAWTFKSVSDDLERFLSWEQQQPDLAEADDE